MITEMKLIGKTAVVLGLALSFSNAYADFEKSYTTDDPIIQDEGHEGQTYSVINGEMLFDSKLKGKPGVPSVTMTFYIPQGEKVSNVVFVANQTKNVTLKHKLLPVQEPIPTGENNIRFAQPDNAVYGSSAAYPSKRLTFSNEQGVGSVKMVQVTVNPMTYYPQKNKLSVATSYTVKVKTVSDTKSSSAKCSIRESDVDDYVRFVKQMVYNPEMVENDLATTLKSQCSKATLRAGSTERQKAYGIDVYEYVVITKREFIPAFEQLLTWKRQKGLDAGAVAIEDILKISYNASGFDEIKDKAGKVRAYLKASYDKGGKYVLIGGNSDIVPARIRYDEYYTIDKKTNEEIFHQRYVPTDYYYSDLEGTWNKGNANSRYGNKLSDVRPTKNGKHLYVGRLLCLDQSDILRWTRKQLLYERDPGLGDNEYLNRSLWTTSDIGLQKYTYYYRCGNSICTKDYNNYSEKCRKELWPSVGSTKEEDLKYYEEVDGCTLDDKGEYHHSAEVKGPLGSTIISDINKNKYGFLSFHNHGSVRDICVASVGQGESTRDNCNIVSQDVIDKNPAILKGGRDDDGNGFDNLTNFNYPAVVYSQCCDNMPFDDYDGYKANYNVRNMGEAFTCANDGGGVAFLGNTREGYWNEGERLFECFLSCVYSHNVTKDGGRKLGILEYESKQNEVKSYSDPYTICVHNLLGCPETSLWTKKPYEFTNKSVSYDPNRHRLVIGFKKAISELVTICVTSKSDGGKTYRAVKTGSLSLSMGGVTFENVPEDYVLVVTADSHLPWIEERACSIQNETFYSTEVYEGCYDINVGREVTNSKPYGDVILEEKSKVTLDAAHNTTLQGGVYVIKGAELKIK